jgi:tetratricopeptide (TPR) repeat protein
MIPLLLKLVLGLWRRRWRLSLAAALVGPLALGVMAISRAVRAELYYRAAERALEQSNHARRQANLALARENLAACLELRPGSGGLHLLAARAARRSGAYDDAARHLRRAQELDWAEEELRLEWDLLRAQQGELDPVESRLLSFLHDDPPEKPLVLEALAQGYLRTYQLLRALDCLDRWLEVQPDNPQALVWRGQTRLLLGLSGEALEDYQRAVALDPEEDEAREKLAQLLLARHRAQEALPHFARWLERQPDSREALLGSARCEIELGCRNEAIAQLDSLLALEPSYAAALAERGRLALEAGQTVEAEKWLRRAYELAPFERETVYNLQRCLQTRGQPEKAKEFQALLDSIDRDCKRLDELKSAVIFSPHDASLRSEMGRILLRNGQDKEGVRWLQSALKEDEHHGPSCEALAEYYRKQSARQR